MMIKSGGPNMTEIEYTDSALNDAFVKFFKSFKLGREYKYLDMIQGAIQEPHKIVIDCSDFTPKLQNIMKNETPAKIHVAIYRAITETFQVKFQGDADRFKKNDLFQYEIINHAELAGQTFRKPSAPTKAVLIAQIAKIIKNLPKEDQVFDRVYQPIISKSGIGYMEDFREGQQGYKELAELIKWHLNEQETGQSVRFAVELLSGKFHFAHIDDEAYAEQNNCYVYRNNRWDRNVPHFVRAAMKKYRDLEDFRINKAVTFEVEAELSTEEKTLQVSMNNDYRKLRSNMIIDGSGHYFDLQEGVIRDIDPSLHFFESVDIKYELINDAREPTQFIEMLKVRYGTNWEIVRDHFAGAFLHVDNLGTRAKALTLVGPTNTWKSTIIDKFADLLNDDAVTTQTIKQLTRDGFGKSMIANKILNHSQEETAQSMQQGHEVLKEVITASKNKVRRMFSPKMISVYRYPRWILATNKLPAIGKDDEDASIFNRFLYIKSLPVSKQDKHWRDLFNTKREKEEILMYLLNRAYQICREPAQMHTILIKDPDKITFAVEIGIAC